MARPTATAQGRVELLHYTILFTSAPEIEAFRSETRLTRLLGLSMDTFYKYM